MEQIACTLFAFLAVAAPPCAAMAQAEGGDGSNTIVLDSPDHPLNGTWLVIHGAGTVACPQMTMPIPAGNPETVEISVHDGGARLEASTSDGAMTLKQVTADEWASGQEGGMQVLRRKMRDDANWIAWAAGGDATIYEGTQAATGDMTIRYILGWSHGESDLLHGHLVSESQGCTVTRPFEFRRRG